MYCTNCGRQFEENDKFCSQCGTPRAQQPRVVLNDSVVKEIDASTHLQKTDVGGANVGGSITIEAEKQQIEACPICGKNNAALETFNCTTCGRKFVCMSHQIQTDTGLRVCNICETGFDVILKEFGANNVAVIKAMVQLLNISLQEARSALNAAPFIVKANIPKAEAEATRKRLAEAGAIVEVVEHLR